MKPIKSLADIPLTEQQRIDVLEWYAWKIWQAQVEAELCDSGCKSYDPLSIEHSEMVAHSYVFDFKDGGRHHPYKSLTEIEGWLDEEVQSLARLARNGIDRTAPCDKIESVRVVTGRAI